MDYYQDYAMTSDRQANDGNPVQSGGNWIPGPQGASTAGRPNLPDEQMMNYGEFQSGNNTNSNYSRNQAYNSNMHARVEFQVQR